MEFYDPFNNVTSLSRSLRALSAHYMGGSIWVFNSRVSFHTSEILKKPTQAQDLLLCCCRIKKIYTYIYINNLGICELEYFMLTAAFVEWSNWTCAFCLTIAIETKSEKELFVLNLGCECLGFYVSEHAFTKEKNQIMLGFSAEFVVHSCLRSHLETCPDP